MSKKKDYIPLSDGLAIYKMEKSVNWYIYLWDKETKKAIQRSLRIPDQKKAEHKAIFFKMALEENLEGAFLSKPSKLIKSIVKELVAQFEKERTTIKKEHEKDKNRNKKPLSKHNKYKESGRYIKIFKDFSEKLGTINIKELDYAHLLVFYKQYDNKISTTQIRYTNQAINKILEYSLTERLITNVPRLPKIKSKVSETGKYFTNTDFQTIVNKIKSRKGVKKIEKENNKLLLQAFLFTTETGISACFGLNRSPISVLSDHRFRD